MSATAVKLLGWCRAAEGSVQCRSPSGRARLGQWPHVCVCHGRHATRMVPSSRGEGATPLPAGRALLLPGSHACGHHCHHAARLLPSSGGEGATPLPAGSSPAVTRAGSHVCGRHGRHATRLAPSSGGDGATPLPAGPRPASIGAPRMWAPRPSRYSAGAEQRRGGRNAALRRAERGSGRGPTSVGATAVTLLDWCPAAEGRAQRHCPPGRARPGPGPHVCGCLGRQATRLVPSS